MNVDTHSPEHALVLVSLLALKHFFADFPFQSNWMIQQKGLYGRPGGILHSAIHGGLTTIVFLLFSPSVALLSGLIDSVTHYHIDYAKMRLGGTYKLTPNDKNFWVFIGLDQYLHYMTYITLVWVIYL